ncbi:hypothetical protein BKA58DRAFT_228521 [Alternaria rosae]|uniref:uncharacterized protein n=1 Tax=Alternaria rosae TaxID=1187941 RepID=UPI001E8CB77A|nr:uncharacterized protein BKA58DRAFT_228521 [Alternaria rosae]KAH6865857.1 hypothetical protein BKA58DRAFT_228521 [Alternaria rosae]
MSMMPTAQPCDASLMDRSNGQESICGPAASDPLNETNANPSFRSIHAMQPDPFAYHRAFLDTSSSQMQPQSQGQGRDRHHIAQDHDDYIRHDVTGTGDMQHDMEYQQQARARGVPYNLAVRLANRSNGAPLATIVEQGSYSTLNSHGSLLSVGRFPSLRVVENASPTRSSPRIPYTPEGLVLQRITEDAQRGHLLKAPNNTHDLPLCKNNSNSFRADDAAIPSEFPSLRPSQSITCRNGRTDGDANTSNVKAFFRGVIHNVRAASRTRSRSSSMQMSLVKNQSDRPGASEDSLQSHLQASDMSQLGDDTFDTPYRFPAASQTLSTTKVLASEHQARNGQFSMADPSSSAHTIVSNSDVDPYTPESQTAFGAVSKLLPPSATARPRKRSSSVRLVFPEPRDWAHDGGSAEVLMLSNEVNNNVSAGHTFYGASKNTHSLTQHDHATEASHNASFCSTMSTSYSGTVVGVDVDLQHDFPHPVRPSRSPTPVAPVWFTPQMAELERQASLSESPPEPNQVTEAEPPRRSITSSALTSLLPIASASGIVRPNYDTPKISFFSPSGNLIQPEGSSTPGTTSASDLSGSPTATTLYYDNKTTPATYHAFPTTTCLPPPRPSLRPMTTPPTSSVPLPVHLRFYHNYRRPEQSQIDSTVGSTESFILPAPLVQGCDGIAQTESLAPCSRPRHSYEKPKARPRYKPRRSARSFAEDLKYEVRFHRARLITAIIASCTSSGKGRVLRKRKAANRRAAATAYVSMPRSCAGEATTRSRKKRIHPRQPTARRDVGVLGPLAGHILRICFCQPYDGAGKTTAVGATNKTCIGKSSNHTGNKQSVSKKESPRSNANDVDVDAALPNARIVTGTERKIGNTVRQRTTVRKEKRHSSTGTNHHSRTRSDSALNVGVAPSTATVRG